MKAIKVIISLNTGTKAEIDALLVSPGLAIHKSFNGFKNQLEPYDNWTVTHINSGYALCEGISNKKARELCEMVTKVMKWDEWDGDVNMMRMSLQKKIKSLITKCK